MNDKHEIEAALEHSLRRKVRVPRLDSRFDKAVWARIEAQESRSASAALPLLKATPKAARWLYFINIAGLASAAIFVSVFGAQMLAGLEIDVALPEISAVISERTLSAMSIGISAAALLIGLVCTPWGRRLREELG